MIYKWDHSRPSSATALADKYDDLAAAGWMPTEAEIRRDTQDLFGGAFDASLIVRDLCVSG